MARKSNAKPRYGKILSGEKYADTLVSNYYNRIRFNFDMVFNPTTYAQLERDITNIAQIAGVNSDSLCEKWYLG
jgi:hypothetical protein